MRKKQFFDKRVKLRIGDYVKLTKSARKILKKNTGVDAIPSDTFKVTNIKYDEDSRKYLVMLFIRGRKIDFYLSDVIFAH